MNTDTDVNLVGRLLGSVVSPELSVNLLGALHGMNHRGEVYQKGIANGLDNRAVMLGDSLLNELIMGFQQSQRAGFVAAHLAAKAYDVGEHDRGQLAGLDSCRFVCRCTHGKRLSYRRLLFV